MRVFSNLNLDDQAPVRAHAGRGVWGPKGVPTTRFKKVQRIVTPFVVVGIAVVAYAVARLVRSRTDLVDAPLGPQPEAAGARP